MDKFYWDFTDQLVVPVFVLLFFCGYKTAMPLLTANDLTHAFGAHDLFTDLSLKLDAKERVGLVGPNGVGKTTLLGILAGEIEPTSGTVSIQNELTLGMLRQEVERAFVDQARTVYEEMVAVFADLVAIEQEMRQLEQEMAAGATESSVFDNYSELQTRYEVGGGYDYQLKIKQVLDGLGFEPDSWQTPLAHLSGGQKTRLQLGRLLLEAPDLLIMDEPTNHLDQAAVEWLERTLNNYRGTLLMISHDRYFLDRVTTTIWDMSPEALRRYKGNYSAYVVQREAEIDRERALFDGEMARLTAELDWIRRHMAGGKTDMAKGKLKRLTRDIVLIEEVGVLGKEGKAWSEIGGRVRTMSVNEATERLKQLQPPAAGPAKLKIKLKSDEQSGIIVVKTQRLTVGYPDAPLFKTEKIRLERDDVAAIIGPNGSGKTTLLKTVLGEIPPLRGRVDIGDNVKIGYFAQAHDQLNDENRVIDELLTRFPVGEQHARTHLGAYQFRGDDVFKTVAALSGGERGRLALALLALEEANFLLLDEPTNHLDIPSQETLQAVLERFDGTILLVSHDRYLIDQLATQIWLIDDNRLDIFHGSYGAFLAHQRGETLEPPPKEDGAGRGVKVAVTRQPDDASNRPVRDLSWVEEISPSPETSAGRSKKSRRGGGKKRRAAAYLDTLYEALELAQLAGDQDEIGFLEEEIATAEAEYEGLGGKLVE